MRSVDDNHLGFGEEINEKKVRNNRLIGFWLPSIALTLHIYRVGRLPHEKQKLILN
jgi:hypothetical protein